MTIDSEIKKIKLEKNTAIAIPIMTSTIGYFIGDFTGNAAENYNTEINTLETNLQAVMKEYRQTESKIEQEIDKIPGLNWYKGINERLFGEAQETINLSEENFTKIKPEDISLQGINLPEDYGMYSLIGLALGFTYGIAKVRTKISRLNREKKILERLR